MKGSLIGWKRPLLKARMSLAELKNNKDTVRHAKLNAEVQQGWLQTISDWTANCGCCVGVRIAWMAIKNWFPLVFWPKVPEFCIFTNSIWVVPVLMVPPLSLADPGEVNSLSQPDKLGLLRSSESSFMQLSSASVSSLPQPAVKGLNRSWELSKSRSTWN